MEPIKKPYYSCVRPHLRCQETFLCPPSPKMISYALFHEFLSTKSLLSSFSTTATLLPLAIAKLISVSSERPRFKSVSGARPEIGPLDPERTDVWEFKLGAWPVRSYGTFEQSNPSKNCPVILLTDIESCKPIWVCIPCNGIKSHAYLSDLPSLRLTNWRVFFCVCI